MSPKEQARARFEMDEPGQDFAAALRLFSIPPRCVVDTPEVFCLAERVKTAWFIYLLAGRLEAIWEHQPPTPQPMTHVFWRRAKNEVLHFYSLERIERISRQHHVQRLQTLH